MNLHYILLQQHWYQFKEFKSLERAYQQSAASSLTSDDQMNTNPSNQSQIQIISKSDLDLDEGQILLKRSASSFDRLEIWWWTEYFLMKRDDERHQSSWSLIESFLV